MQLASLGRGALDATSDLKTARLLRRRHISVYLSIHLSIYRSGNLPMQFCLSIVCLNKPPMRHTLLTPSAEDDLASPLARILAYSISYFFFPSIAVI